MAKKCRNTILAELTPEILQVHTEVERLRAVLQSQTSRLCVSQDLKKSLQSLQFEKRRTQRYKTIGMVPSVRVVRKSVSNYNLDVEFHDNNNSKEVIDFSVSVMESSGKVSQQSVIDGLRDGATEL